MKTCLKDKLHGKKFFFQTDDCGYNQFKCPNYCIPNVYVNDGKIDCLNTLSNSDVANTIIKDEIIKTRTVTNRVKNCSIYYELSTGFPVTNLFKQSCAIRHDRSDRYLCYKSNYSISVDLVCDGIQQCLLGDDEMHCGSFYQTSF